MIAAECRRTPDAPRLGRVERWRKTIGCPFGAGNATRGFLRELGVLPRRVAAFLSRRIVGGDPFADGAFMSLLESAPDAMVIVDDHGRVVLMNARLAVLFGYQREELLGQPIEVLVPERVRTAHAQHRAAYLKTPKARPLGSGLDLQGRHKHGAEFPVEISLSPMPTARGVFVIAAVRDVTERRRAEEALRQARAELEQRVATRTAELQTANASLQREISERRRLEQELLIISDMEQRRIGEDLHDGLGQHLLGVALKGQTLEQQLAAKSPQEARRVGDIVQLIYQAITETRELSRGLCLGDLSAEGLPAALSQLAAFMEQISGVWCRCVFDPAVAIADETAAIQVYRIAQEALNNAIKHSQAKQVDITLTLTEGRPALMVRDDGVGLPSDLHESAGLGLRIMRHRARTIGASLDIRPAPTHGTVVVCVLPAPSDAG
jgi:PAS domain S-box-containing protein